MSSEVPPTQTPPPRFPGRTVVSRSDGRVPATDLRLNLYEHGGERRLRPAVVGSGHTNTETLFPRAEKSHLGIDSNVVDIPRQSRPDCRSLSRVGLELSRDGLWLSRDG